MVRYEAFRARCLLTALDHNNHTTRDDAKTKTTSEIRFHRKFNKNSWQWTVKRVKVLKIVTFHNLLVTFHNLSDNQESARDTIGA